jgi:uncharacterized protein YrrD
MIRAKELGGRAVVDVDAAEKLGKIDRIVLDPESRRVAGFVVSKGSSIFSNDADIVISASCVHAVGPDAVTVHRTAGFDSGTTLDSLPRVSDIAGRKVVSDQGRLMGTVDDVLIDENDGRIVGYALSGDGFDDKLRNAVAGVSGDRSETKRAAFLRADANLRAGKDLIVAPEDAVSFDWEAMESPAAASHVDTPRRWDRTAPSSGAAATQWLRDDAGARPSGSEGI